MVDEEPHQAKQSERFYPFRRRVHYFASHDAPIGPLLDELTFTQGRASWGMILRRGTFEIDHHDYDLIAKAMNVSGH